jgi:hypothetical protein
MSVGLSSKDNIRVEAGGCVDDAFTDDLVCVLESESDHSPLINQVLNLEIFV